MEHDIEKNRIEYVQRVETQLEHLLGEYVKYKAIAEKWQPTVSTAVDPAKQLAKIGLMLGGRATQTQVTFDSLALTDQMTAVSAISDALMSVVQTALREILEPEVAKLYSAVNVVQQAGNWGS